MGFSLSNFPLRRRAACLAFTLLAGASAWAQHEHAAPAASAQPAPVRQPRLQLGSGVALAPDGTLWLAGLNAKGQLFVQSAPAPVAGVAQPWSAPRVLDTGSDVIAADGENHPKLLFSPNATVLITYTQALPKHHAGHVRLLRSVDGGQAFAAPVTLHTDRQELTHRFEVQGFDAQGHLHTVWVDSRDQEAAPSVGGKSSYRGAAIYRNVSTDGGASFGPDLKLADHACECCRIALGLGSDGVLRAMWRHVFAPNVRDHAIAALTSAPQAPIVRATFDEWKIDGCPHHGPGLAGAADGFHTVWFGIRDKVAGVRYARLNADGSPQPETVRLLPDARAEHADVMANGPRVAVVWRSSEGMTSTLKAWLSSDGGQTFREHTLGQAQGANDFARLVRSGPRMVVVWRNASEVQVHELPF